MAEEIWRPVAGYEGAYEVSDRGRVKSVERTVRGGAAAERRVKERILRPVPRHGTRFFRVTLSSQSRRRRCYIHKLKAAAFSDT